MLDAFKRKGMGTAWSRGSGDHLAPVKLEGSPYAATQADELRHELVIELMTHTDEVWQNGEEEGLVRVKRPEKGTMLRMKITGQVVVYVNADGELCVDEKGY
jgi:hypothetical protein